MVLSIARQSVIIKCKLQASVMTGNYEFYYAAGLLYQRCGINTEDIPEPQALSEQVHEMTEDFQTEDGRERHLVHMLKYYKPVADFDEQMKELFLMGNRETNMWQDHLPGL